MWRNRLLWANHMGQSAAMVGRERLGTAVFARALIQVALAEPCGSTSANDLVLRHPRSFGTQAKHRIRTGARVVGDRRPHEFAILQPQ